MELRRLAAERRDADGVLEQAAGVGVVVVGRRRIGGEVARREHGAHGRGEAGMRDLAGEELEEPLQLVGVAAQRGGEGRRVDVGRLERAHVELEAVAEALDAAEHPHRVALAEAPVEQLDVVPDAGVDAAARVDELEREVRRAALRAQLPLGLDGEDALDDAVFGELGDHARESTVGSGRVPDLAFSRAPIRRIGRRPARRSGRAALRRDRRAGAPGYLDASPYNIVHLTLPESEQAAGATLADWRERGVLRLEEPALWWIAQHFTGPDGVERTREGLAASIEATPYSERKVLPHELTHAGPKEGRLRLLRATRTQLEPIFLLYDADPVAERPDREPDMDVERPACARRCGGCRRTSWSWTCRC